MITVRSKPTPCPAGCGYVIDSTTGMTDPRAVPAEGDFSLCINCGSYLTYTKDLTMRVFTHEELIDLEPTLRKTLHDVHETWFWAIKGGKHDQA